MFWNQHERERGVYDFSGRLDLFGFLQTISQAGLYALLRIGPYICAETNFGGFPHWLRDIEGIYLSNTCFISSHSLWLGIQFRTQNEPFQRESSRWVRYLVEQLNLHRCFFTQGGPIIMVQLENEYKLIGQNYGEAGRNYLKWCSELAKGIQNLCPSGSDRLTDIFGKICIYLYLCLCAKVVLRQVLLVIHGDGKGIAQLLVVYRMCLKLSTTFMVITK